MAILHLQLTGNTSTHTLQHDIKNQKVTLRKVVIQKNGTSHTFGGGVYLNFSRSVCSSYQMQSPSASNGMFFVPLSSGVSGMQTHDFHVSFQGMDMTQISIDTVNDDATTPATFGANGLKQIDLYFEYAESMHFH
jgi:hypothetical protein